VRSAKLSKTAAALVLALGAALAVISAMILAPV
jgi:hypothetical protein